ncbi:citrate lyase holo-[acyl-carrier protein] synthase [Lentilactobacillus sp. SPB1-3]|uniref:Citrate lyase holo-[acyl-carrier protein] synthase n=1 Tax=Lentilactobacillus terminaliae TaxID=3003483 RepID=A0ACD5DFI1_9LACO|nr:citrate lyase holo-[acyl-carrier protein] synthase [Lentilactobacillus sp. SPB1-3]MCZ0976690.1 citrate lyase holo-[acyl-carrier protein] synthase [Lentilactobacillus sp. SPB1-3]
MQNIFIDGNQQEIEDVLANRDARVEKQHQLLADNPEMTVVAIKLNIPGPIKNNSKIKQLFDAGMATFLQLLKDNDIQYTLNEEWNKDTGNEAFLLVSDTQLVVKRLAVQFEDKDKFGRIFDVDVLGHHKDASISRTALELPVRKCFICDRPAKECARSRRHSVEELQLAISTLVESEF